MDVPELTVHVILSIRQRESVHIQVLESPRTINIHQGEGQSTITIFSRKKDGKYNKRLKIIIRTYQFLKIHTGIDTRGTGSERTYLSINRNFDALLENQFV